MLPPQPVTVCLGNSRRDAIPALWSVYRTTWIAGSLLAPFLIGLPLLVVAGLAAMVIRWTWQGRLGWSPRRRWTNLCLRMVPGVNLVTSWWTVVLPVDQWNARFGIDGYRHTDHWVSLTPSFMVMALPWVALVMACTLPISGVTKAPDGMALYAAFWAPILAWAGAHFLHIRQIASCCAADAHPSTHAAS